MRVGRELRGSVAGQGIRAIRRRGRHRPREAGADDGGDDLRDAAARRDATAAGRCARASTRTRACSSRGGCRYTVAGLETFALTCVEAFAGHVAVVKPQSAFFEVFGSRGRGRPRARPRSRCARPAPSASSTPSAATSARRWRPTPQAYLADDAPAARRRRHGEPLPRATSRCVPRSTSRPAPGGASSCSALTSNPEGRTVQHAGGCGTSASPAAWSPGRRADNAAARAAWRARAAWAWSSARPSATPCSELGLDLAGRQRAPAGPRRGRPGRHGRGPAPGLRGALPNVLARSSREVLSAGPERRRPAGTGARGRRRACAS